MVLLAASVCTRGGKPVISRQFREMPRSRVEALLASFPKLISAGAQHTTVETDAVRYVYQPLEDLYMVLITNKSSNILQDIDTLHLFARLVSDMCRSLDERDVALNAFELLGAFDEIIALGYRENVNLQQIRSILEMESHEEKIQEIIERNKELEAKEELKRRARQLEMQRRNAGGGAGGRFANGGMGQVPRFDSPAVTEQAFSTPSHDEPSQPAAKPFKGKGMQLGKKGKNSALLGAMSIPAEEEGAPLLAAREPEAPAPVAARAAAPATTSAPDPFELLPPVTQESVHLIVKERVSVAFNRDGGVDSLELKGDLEVRITDAAVAKLRLQLTPSSSSPLSNADELVYKTHPHVDKNLWTSSRVIALKDPARPFPVRQNLGVLRWRLTGKDEANIPLTLNVWPSLTATGGADVTVEYELNSALELGELQHVRIEIPLPAGAEDEPQIADGAPGNARVDWDEGKIIWELGSIAPGDESESGALEFSIAKGATSLDEFYPVSVTFVATGTMSGVEVQGATQADTQAQTTFSIQTALSTDAYHLGA